MLVGRRRRLLQLDRFKMPMNVTTRAPNVNFGAALRVLLVDDDELALAWLGGILSANEFEVCTATGSLEALASMKAAFAPVLITDLKMPGMDGLELCRTIRQQAWPGYIYILVLTAQDAEEDILAGLSAGADDYLSKRMSPAQLLARLRTAQRILTLERSLKKALAQRRREALTDSLTGAPNRRYFVRRLSRELDRLKLYGGDLCLMSLDIDHFKQINDRYGHASGDSVLKEFVQRIGRCLPRNTDWCARMGGEEFSVVLEETKLAGARTVAERLRQAIAETPVLTRAGLVHVTVSIGVSSLEAESNREGITIDSLLHQADRYLYVSKESGRNRVTFPGLDAAT
jgi:two-component system cell cycle response regulator